MSDDFLNEVRDAVARGNLCHAVWLIENRSEARGDAEAVARARSLIDCDQLRQQSRALEKDLADLDSLLGRANGLEFEEAALVLTDISVAFAVQRFLSREAADVKLPALDAILLTIAGCDRPTVESLRGANRTIQRNKPSRLPTGLAERLGP